MLCLSTFKSSIRLYGLVKNVSGAQAGLALTTKGPNGHPAVQTFVSRLDAELMLCTCGDEDLQVRLLSQFFDPNPFLAANRGWLTLHIGSGFAANTDRLIKTDERLQPMGWIVHADIGMWTPGHYLYWGEQLSRQLQATYDAAGLHHYNTQLNELDEASAQDIRWNATEALNALPDGTCTTGYPTQVALFDAIECRWCFAKTNTQGNCLHDTRVRQGGLS
ncbi:hypothetical protein J2Y74_002349 [Pseudomonas migulae]|uniref:hypothetical protein n=1 Tax=Pseudomonas migulae TaxID=78543 RepID=UPI00209F9A27|nr:hypothetical protein [Pseudomonas migulae]MCP1518039.1 hypothetical protein [Pseudomonas migulae]